MISFYSHLGVITLDLMGECILSSENFLVRFESWLLQDKYCRTLILWFCDCLKWSTKKTFFVCFLISVLIRIIIINNPNIYISFPITAEIELAQKPSFTLFRYRAPIKMALNILSCSYQKLFVSITDVYYSVAKFLCMLHITLWSNRLPDSS